MLLGCLWALRYGSTSTTGEVLRDFRYEMLTIDDVAVSGDTSSAIDTGSQRLYAESLLVRMVGSPE